MTEHTLLDADSHVSEPLNLWQERLPAKYRDKAPRMLTEYERRPGAWWLIEDLGHLRCRLRKTLPATSTSETGQRLPSVNVIAETETRPTASSRDDLDTAISIGNQIRSSTPARSIDRR